MKKPPKKSVSTERRLFDALDALVAGTSTKTDGKLTQENIALEAGVSRATFNRYSKVVAEYRRARLQRGTEESAQPFKIEDKNRELQESNTAVRRAATEERKKFKQQLAAARQEIFVLSQALKLRDEMLAARTRETKELGRQVAELQKKMPGHLALVKK